MPWILRTKLSVTSDAAIAGHMAAQSSETKNATLNLINDQVPGLVSDAIASDTTVADAAALAASAAVDEELDTSPRIPEFRA